MEGRKKVLFVYDYMSVFVKLDLEFMQSRYDVTVYQFRINKPARIPFRFIRQFFFLLFKIRKFDAVFVWFADYHSLLPVLFAKWFKRESFVVIGGYEVCRIRELKYGGFKSPFRGCVTRMCMKNCTLNLCVSSFIQRKVNAVEKKAHTVVVHNGVNIAPPEANPPKEKLILMVGDVRYRQRIRIKGMDTVFYLAKKLPHEKFVVVGSSLELLTQEFGEIPDNIEVFPFLEQKKLIDFYSRAKVYIQLSIIESFAVTLAEAMLYRCIPVATKVGGMPEVIGDCGYLVRNKEEALVCIEKAMADPDTAEGERCRERVLKTFMFQNRAEKLSEILDQIN